MNSMQTMVTCDQSIELSSRRGHGSLSGANTSLQPPARSTANCPARSPFKGWGLPATRSVTRDAASRSSRRVLSLRAHAAPSFRSATAFFSHSSRIFLSLKLISKGGIHPTRLYLIGKLLKPGQNPDPAHSSGSRLSFTISVLSAWQIMREL